MTAAEKTSHRIPESAVITIEKTDQSKCWRHNPPGVVQIRRDLQRYDQLIYTEIDGSDEYTFSDCYLEGTIRYTGETATFRFYDTDILEVRFPSGDFRWFVPPAKTRLR